MSTTTGTIVRVRRDPAGDGLAADAAIGATSLVLGWAIDFDPEGGTLQVGAEVIAYTAVDDDTDTVTLAAATTVAYEAGEPVLALDTLGAQAETWTLDVGLADSGQTVPAVPVHSLLSMLREGEAMAGMQVEVQTTDDGNVIRSIDGKGAAVESDLIMRGGHIYSQTPAGVTTTAIGPLTTTGGEDTFALEVQTTTGQTVMAAIAEVTGFPDGLFYVGQVGTTPMQLPYVAITGSGVTLWADEINPGDGATASINSGPTHSYVQVGDSTFGVAISTGNTHRMFITDDSLNAGLGFTSDPANVNISTTNGELMRVTSSRRYKQNIAPARVDVQAALKLKPRRFRTKAEVKALGKDAPEHVGFIAEEADALGLDDFVGHDEDGPESFHYPLWVVALQAIAQDQAKQIAALEKRLAKLESGDR